MGIKERRADAEMLLKKVRAGVEPPPARVMASGGYAFLLADLDLQVSILGRPIAGLERSLPELRGKLQALSGPPPYRSEALSEAYTYPLLIAGPEGPVAEAYLSFGEHGARLLFVPSHNGLPWQKADVVQESRAVDVRHATELGVWVVRADVAGRCGELVSYGSSAIVDPHGAVRHAAPPFEEQLLVADLS